MAVVKSRLIINLFDDDLLDFRQVLEYVFEDQYSHLHLVLSLYQLGQSLHEEVYSNWNHDGNYNFGDSN